ncbi:MAG: GtrA family protein [bacterium]|nr:GtrA family protein [bacterium]
MRIADLVNAELRRSFIRYATIGVSNTALNFGMYAALTRGTTFWRAHYLAANALAFVVAVTWSFFWNKRWSFGNRERRYGVQYAKFILVTVVGLGIEQGMLALGVATLGILDLLAKLLAAPLVVLWNFTMYRVWAFKEITAQIRTDHS